MKVNFQRKSFGAFSYVHPGACVGITLDGKPVDGDIVFADDQAGLVLVLKRDAGGAICVNHEARLVELVALRGAVKIQMSCLVRLREIMRTVVNDIAVAMSQTRRFMFCVLVRDGRR